MGSVAEGLALITGGERATWLARDIADRKVLINAMEEGFVAELLLESFVIKATGREQDFPALELDVARSTFGRLALEGLVGVYRLDEPDSDFAGKAAVERVAADDVWLTPASFGLCLFLTPDGERAVGIARS